MKYPELVEKLTLEDKIRLVTGYGSWHTYPVEKIDLKSVMMTDGPIGLRKVDEGKSESYMSVCFPSGCLTACSFDRDLLKEMGEHLGDECQAYDVSLILGPAMNIKRSPLCGRNFEYYSEDPTLSGEMAASYVEGVQSKGVGATIKHFICNNQEYRRMSYNALIDERALREIYLAGYELAVKKSHPYAVMCSYNKVNGEHLSDSKRFLTDILRDEWGFDGIVMSDWGAVYRRDLGIKAGLDLEMPGNKWANEGFIKRALADGSITLDELDTCVDRIIDIVRRCEDRKLEFPFKEDHDLSGRIAEESMVLLRNENNVLPLTKGEKIAVVGEFAVKPRIQGGGSAFINCYAVDSTLEELKKFGDTTYFEGFKADSDERFDDLFDEAVKGTEGFDMVVVMAGLPDSYESEGFDRKHMRLPKVQDELIEKLAESGKKIVVVLQNGASLELPWAEKVDSIVEAYLGGEAVGQAIARVLYGEVNPSGKLAETFPYKLEDNPSYLNFPGDGYTVNYAESIYVGYRYYQKKRINVRYPFGYGLSYTQFAYSNLKVSGDSITDGGKITVSADITNTGSRRGKETVQLYVADAGDQTGRAPRCVRELRDFSKVDLAPGETKTVAFELPLRAFAYYEERLSDWIVPDSVYRIEIGASSEDIRLCAEIRAKSQKQLPLEITEDTVFGELLRDERTKQYTLDNLINKQSGGISSFPPDAIAALMDHNPIRGLRNFGNEPADRVDEILYEIKDLVK